MIKQIKAYRCNAPNHVHNFTPDELTICASSRGKAISRFCQDTGARFVDVRTQVVPIHTPDEFKRIAKYRGVPDARIGQLVSVNGKIGRIVGTCDCNFNVEFEEGGVFNCHPNWKMEFFEG